MAFRDLVNGYLEEARADNPDDNEARLTALRAERDALWTLVKGGDWESTSTTFSTSSTTGHRGISASDRHRAVKKAIDILEENEDAIRYRSGIITPRYVSTPLG